MVREVRDALPRTDPAGFVRDLRRAPRERNQTDGPPDKWLFESVDQFLRWFAKQRPKSYRRFQSWNRKRARAKTGRELRRLKRVALAPRVAAR